MITVKELARGLKQPVDEVITLIESSGMGKVDEESVLRNSQAMILYDIIKKKKDRRNERLRFDREQQNTFNRLMDSDMIFIDTCSLLKPQAELFWDRAESILRKRQAKIIIPFSVIREMWKHTDNPEKPGLQDFANHALDRIEELVSQNLVEISGEESDCLADQTFMKLIEKYRFDRQILLITEDLNLSIDALSRNQTRSSTFIPLKVANVRFDGYLKQQNLQDLEIRALKKEAREAREEEMRRERERENGNPQKNEPRDASQPQVQGQSYCSVCGRDMTKENARLIRQGREPHNVCNRCYYKEKNEPKEKGKENRPIKKTVREQRREPGYIGAILSEYKGLGPGSKECDSLRVFYNGWLSRKEAGKRAAELYYLNLNSLEEGLRQSERRDEIMKMLWKGYLSPAIKAIKRFEYRSADKKLKGMTQRLAEQVDVQLVLPEDGENPLPTPNASDEPSGNIAQQAGREALPEGSQAETEKIEAEKDASPEKSDQKKCPAKSERKRSRRRKNGKKPQKSEGERAGQKAEDEASESPQEQFTAEPLDQPGMSGQMQKADQEREASAGQSLEDTQEEVQKEEPSSEGGRDGQAKNQNCSSGKRSGKRGSQNRKKRRQSGERQKPESPDQEMKEKQPEKGKPSNPPNPKKEGSASGHKPQESKHVQEEACVRPKRTDDHDRRESRKRDRHQEQKEAEKELPAQKPPAAFDKGREEQEKKPSLTPKDAQHPEKKTGDQKNETLSRPREVKETQTPAGARKTAARTRVSQKKTARRINPITRWIPRRKKKQ